MTKPVPPVMPSRPATSDDSFLSGAISVRQPADGYRVGTDAVMLAASINPGKKTGTCAGYGGRIGAVSLAVRRALCCGHITAIEKDPFCAELLAHNIAENNLAEAIRPVQGILPKCR